MLCFAQNLVVDSLSTGHENESMLIIDESISLLYEGQLAVVLANRVDCSPTNALHGICILYF